MKKLYRFYYAGGDMNFLSGLFIEEEKNIDILDNKILYFDLDHWNQYELTREDYDITEYKLSEATVKELELVFNDYICGHNPFDYIKEY